MVEDHRGFAVLYAVAVLFLLVVLYAFFKGGGE